MDSLQLSHHVLAIRNSDQSLEFYLKVIGMTLQRTQTCHGRTHYFLGFGCGRDDNSLIPDYPHCLLELVFDRQRSHILDQSGDGVLPGYWKLALAVVDLELARSRLMQQGIRVSEPVQVPDGYRIQLLLVD